MSMYPPPDGTVPAYNTQTGEKRHVPAHWVDPDLSPIPGAWSPTPSSVAETTPDPDAPDADPAVPDPDGSDTPDPDATTAPDTEPSSDPAAADGKSTTSTTRTRRN